MISAGDFRNGITLEIDGNVVQIVEFQHVKPGKGAAFVRTKLKNVINGGVTEKTFRPTEKFPQARIDRVDMQYLYNDGDLYYFMDVQTYDQVALNKETIGDALKFVKENEMVKVCSYNGNVFAIEPPLFVELQITETEPGFAGNTAQGATKPAIVETGAQVSVSPVCKPGRRDQDRHQNRRVFKPGIKDFYGRRGRCCGSAAGYFTFLFLVRYRTYFHCVLKLHQNHRAL